MTSGVLTKIIENKRWEITQRKIDRRLDSFKEDLSKSDRSLHKALSNDHSDFIFECKKASPSKGLLREHFDLDEILSSYKYYASAISVLTDFNYFKGSFEHLEKVSETVEKPVLCKDFFIDHYQIYEARYHGADAILLMLSVLSNSEYEALAKVAKQLDLDILTEVHDAEEMQRAILLDAKIIGINNRNLNDLSIELSTTESLIQHLDENEQRGRIFISESGITTHTDVQRLSPLVDGFLVGSSLMQQENLSKQCKSLIYGNIKICGITNNESAQHSAKMGASYAGLIFHPKSPRNVSLEKARDIVKNVSIDFVGVFVNEPIETIVSIAKELNLAVIQLHGQENPSYINDLKTQLPDQQIWKAISAKSSEHINNQMVKYLPLVDKILVDTYSSEQSGGIGEKFDWELLKNLPAERTILAGGLNRSNIKLAKKLNTFALDVNSGVEDKPGVKSIPMITSLFETLRT